MAKTTLKPSPEDRLIEDVIQEILREEPIGGSTPGLDRVRSILRASSVPLTATDIFRVSLRLGTHRISRSHTIWCVRQLTILGEIAVEFVNRPVLGGGMRRIPAYRLV